MEFISLQFLPTDRSAMWFSTPQLLEPDTRITLSLGMSQVHVTIVTPWDIYHEIMSNYKRDKNPTGVHLSPLFILPAVTDGQDVTVLVLVVASLSSVSWLCLIYLQPRDNLCMCLWDNAGLPILCSAYSTHVTRIFVFQGSRVHDDIVAIVQ